MCLALPALVISVNGSKCEVEALGIRTNVTLLIGGVVNVGDYVLCHAGAAISTIDENEALDSIKLYEEIQEIINGDGI
jgi:hydrogenase expression/formation protein HypC